MLAHSSVYGPRPIVVGEESCHFGAVRRWPAPMQPLTQQVLGHLALGCLASARGIGAGKLRWDSILLSSAGFWSAKVGALGPLVEAAVRVCCGDGWV